MANLSYNHLWLIGDPEALDPWINADPWAALERLPEWFALFHPEHGYPVGRVVTFSTHRSPVSLFDDRRPGLSRSVDQFLAVADEGWEHAGHEWRLRDHDDQHQRHVSAIRPGKKLHAPPEPGAPRPWVWVADKAQVWLPQALKQARRQRVPVAATGNSLVLRRALWRDDAAAVRELLDAGLSPRTGEDWWAGVRDAVRPRAWPVPGWPTAHRAEGPGGQALSAWLSAMPETFRQVERLDAMLAPVGVDHGVKTALGAWRPADTIWGRTGLDLPSPMAPVDPSVDTAVLALWRSSSPAAQERVAERWADRLREIACSHPFDQDRLAPRVQEWLEVLGEGTGHTAIHAQLPGLYEAWPRVKHWHETRTLRDAVNEATSTLVASARRSRL